MTALCRKGRRSGSSSLLILDDVKAEFCALSTNKHEIRAFGQWPNIPVILSAK